MSQEKIIYLTRVVEFSAAHRLSLPELSDAENLEVFGLCANPNGHGHNYLLEATFKGVQASQTQMVVHYTQLKRLLDEVVVVPLDHRHLNFDVPFLKGVLPTSENIVIKLWEEITGAIRGQTFTLHKLRLQSSSRNWVEYFG
jgi:6-pyruvoyltetrahydropterin/6-carboxytetrahydropterin synthase